jgi:hypothetical protein
MQETFFLYIIIIISNMNQNCSLIASSFSLFLIWHERVKILFSRTRKSRTARRKFYFWNTSLICAFFFKSWNCFKDNFLWFFTRSLPHTFTHSQSYIFRSQWIIHDRCIFFRKKRELFISTSHRVDEKFKHFRLLTAPGTALVYYFSCFQNVNCSWQ